MFLWHNNLRLRKWENFILMSENILSLYFILLRENLRYAIFAAKTKQNNMNLAFWHYF